MSMTKELVVLLHGLGANRFVMSRIASVLRGAGYQVENIGYRSTRGSIDSHARQLQQRLRRWNDDADVGRIHLVTHSMGGIVTRRALCDERPAKLGRIVMMGPPNAGSHVARLFAIPFGRWCPALTELSDEPGSYVKRLEQPANLEIGIVAAAADRVVRLESTMLNCQQDHIVVPGHHGLLPWLRDTAEYVLHFLRSGQFRQEPVATHSCGVFDRVR